MKHYRRTIVLTNRPLEEAFVYRDVFIFHPIKRKGIPSCPYAHHFPAFLDFWVEADEEETELNLTALDINKTREICTVLTALSNYEVFTYDSSQKAWGVAAPSISFADMEPEEKILFNTNARDSVWFPIVCYTYNEFQNDRIISSLRLTEGSKKMILDNNPFYFTDNPIESEHEKVIFHKDIETALDAFFSLDEEDRKVVYSSMVLIAEGIRIGLHHQSIGFLSFISSIETMVGLSNKGVHIHHCEKCGQPIFGVRKCFLSYLAEYVSKTEYSQKKFDDLYKLRSKIAHTGKLFLTDVEFSLLNYKDTGEEWLKYLEVQQLARLSLYRWLLIANKTNTKQFHSL